MKKTIKNITRVLFSLLLIVSIFGTFNVFAENVIFKITNIEVKEKSDKVTVNDVSLSSGSIINDIVFTEKDDYIKYNITLKNTTKDEYTIKSITDDNTSEYLEYTYDDLSNVKLSAGEEKTFELQIKYIKETTNLNIQDESVGLTLTYEKVDGTIGTQKLTNPKTGDNITIYIVMGIISLIGLATATVSKKHLSKTLMSISVISMVVIPFGVRADTDKFTILFNNTIKEKEYTVTFNTNGGTEINSKKVVRGAKVSKPTPDPTKANKDFDNWYTSNEYNELFDFENTEIINDTEIFANWDEIKTLQIGDVINYNANRADKDGNAFDTPYSYVATEELTGSFPNVTYKSNDKVTWKVLNIDEQTGKIQIVAATNTTSLKLYGVTGMKNSLNLIETIAQVYGHGYGAKNVRSITEDDIMKYSSYDVTTHVNEYNATYGEKFTFTGSHLHIFKESSTTVNSNGSLNITYEDDYTVPSETNPITVTNTAYKYDPIDYMDETMYKILVKDKYYRNYWLPSRMVESGNDKYWFGIRHVSYEVGYKTLGWGIRPERNLVGYYTYSGSICPIIELDSNVILQWDKANQRWDLN